MVGSYSWENAKTPNGFIGCTQSTTLFIGTWLIYDDAQGVQHNATASLLSGLRSTQKFKCQKLRPLADKML